MRKDMAKLLLEKGRQRLDWKRRDKLRRWRWAGGDSDWGPVRQRMRLNGHFFENRDYLHPLERWLDTQKGRPWLEVEQELLQGMDIRRTADRHLLGHAYGMVSRCRAVTEKLPYAEIALSRWRVEFETGLLL